MIMHVLAETWHVQCIIISDSTIFSFYLLMYTIMIYTSLYDYEQL